MTEVCCAEDSVDLESPLCPESGARGRSVAWQTVAALVRDRVPARQQFRLCRGSSCPVVYFGSEGTILRSGDLRVSPGFKQGSDGLLCYCFEVREADIAHEIAETGSSGVVDRVTGEVQAGNCACEVRNPTGQCCLADMARAIEDLESQVEVTL